MHKSSDNNKVHWPLLNNNTASENTEQNFSNTPLTNNESLNKYHRQNYTKKRQRRLIRTLTALWLTWAIAYKTSPTISPILLPTQHDIHNTIITNPDEQKEFWSPIKYQTDDFETNMILDLMSWCADKKAFNTILHKYWYKEIIDIDAICHKDMALYRSIRELHQAHGNPHITIWKTFRNPFTDEENPERAFFDWLRNRINIHNIHDKQITFETPNKAYYEDVFQSSQGKLPRSWKENWQRYLINNRIAELAHSVQLQKMWWIKMGIDMWCDEISTVTTPTQLELKDPTHRFDWINNHDVLYDKKGSIEYEAHTIIEKQLIYELIETYKKYADIRDPLVQYQLWIFYNWYFDKLNDPKIAETWLLQSTESTSKHNIVWNKYWCFILWNRYSKDLSDYIRKYNKLDKSDTLSLKETNIQINESFQNTLKYYKRSAKAGSSEAYFRILNLYVTYWYYIQWINSDTTDHTSQEWIKRWKTIINKRPILSKQDSTLTSAKYISALKYLWYFYLKNNDKTQAMMYYKKITEAQSSSQ